MKYKAWVETETVGHTKLVYLFVSHSENNSTGIRIKDPELEIPLIIGALQHHLTSVMRSENRCLECGEPNGKHLFGCKMPKLD